MDKGASAKADQALAVPVEPVARLDPSGFDPSRVEVLSLGYCAPQVGCTKARWWEVFRPFTANARHHAANLAAHEWDVLLVGNRVFLFQTRYGGNLGHWLNEDGTREDVTAAEQSRLYTKTNRRRFAIATEAQRAATVKQGAVHEGAGRRHRPKARAQ